MNQSQLKYARERAKTIFDRRCADIRERHSVKPVSLADEEKLTALRKGKFTILDSSNGRHWYWRIKFDAETEGSVDQKAVDAEIAALKDTYTKLIDELVLGDCDKALEMLTAFAEA